jgi:chromosome partitioning protein
MPVLMFINIKGGVAKTTNTVAVSQFLAERGYRVLVIDADHQCAAGEILLGEPRLEQCDRRGTTLHDLLSAMVKEEFSADTLANYVAAVEAGNDAAECRDLSVVPSSLRIDDFQRNYNMAREEFHSNAEFHAARDRRLQAFRKWLNVNFDYTIIDCPPSLAIQVQMLVKVADAYIVPSVPDKLSVRGCRYLVERLRRKKFNLPGLGTLWSLYREQNTIHRETISGACHGQELFSELPKPFETIIPNATAIARALESSDPSLDVKYSREIANTYRELVDEIVARCRKLPKRYEASKIAIPPQLERKFDDPWSRTSRTNVKQRAQFDSKCRSETRDSTSSQKLKLQKRVEGVLV